MTRDQIMREFSTNPKSDRWKGMSKQYLIEYFNLTVKQAEYVFDAAYRDFHSSIADLVYCWLDEYADLCINFPRD